MVFLLFSRFSQPDHWEYLRHIPLYFFTALQHSHCRIQLHRVSLLEYPVLFVFEYIISPNPTAVFSFETLWFSSIWCSSLQLVSCVQSRYLPQAVSAHLSHSFWIDVSRVCSPTDGAFHVYSLLLGFLNHVLVTISPFLSQKLISIWPLWFSSCFYSDPHTECRVLHNICHDWGYSRNL